MVDLVAPLLRFDPWIFFFPEVLRRLCLPTGDAGQLFRTSEASASVGGWQRRCSPDRLSPDQG